MSDQFASSLSGKYPLVSFRIRRKFQRPAADLVEKFQDAFIPDISDLVGRMYTMETGIRPMYSPAPSLLGSALTVKCTPGDNLGVKQALQMVEPGDVLVVDAQGFVDWCAGGFSMLVRSIKQRGLKGLIVNGAYRDASEAREANFPIYCKGLAAWSGPKRGPFEINVPVCCGGVIVHPGDIVAADEDGAVVVPREYAEAVADRLTVAPGKNHADVLDASDLAQKEENRNEYFERLFHEKNGVYLD